MDVHRLYQTDSVHHFIFFKDSFIHNLAVDNRRSQSLRFDFFFDRDTSIEKIFHRCISDGMNSQVKVVIDNLFGNTGKFLFVPVKTAAGIRLIAVRLIESR